MKKAKPSKELLDLLSLHFEGNEKEIYLFLHLNHPLLGGVSPMDMIRVGREEKLIQEFKSWRDGYFP